MTITLPHGLPHARLRELLVGVLFALLIVTAVTITLLALSPHLPIEHVTIVYLIPVIVAALRWGAIPAMFAGILGSLHRPISSTPRSTTSGFTARPRSPTS
jgi:K+-sensing histidine kinase KdpD